MKGRIGAGDVEITDNEWARACNLRGDYWLYVVYHCGTSKPQLVRVQDPFGSLLVRHIRGTMESGGVRVGHARIMEVAQI